MIQAARRAIQRARGSGSGNSRNGHSGKTVLTEDGAVEPAVPRDRNGTFEPAIMPGGSAASTASDVGLNFEPLPGPAPAIGPGGGAGRRARAPRPHRCRWRSRGAWHRD
ncbi:MAG: hypothetical protein F4181_01395 [Proteobacteria bacterium]|nr:hypothetical protein [Pseudomonadota bacterium]MYK30174.1 hypothetical protein [Boseongicola sp. SB0670_bin_30]